jgi:hypothetical protein
MSNNQSHGKRIEDFIKTVFPWSSDNERKAQSEYDIESEFDLIENLPTEIKTTSSNNICMSDARKIWLRTEPFRLITIKFTQSKQYKQIKELYEWLITAKELEVLKGCISYPEVENFHYSIKEFGPGKENAKLARTFAEDKIKELNGKSIFQLNPKIDSKKQRRLQCSITINNLLKNVSNYNYFNEDNSFYRDVEIIGIRIKSSKREFN